MRHSQGIVLGLAITIKGSWWVSRTWRWHAFVSLGRGTAVCMPRAKFGSMSPPLAADILPGRQYVKAPWLIEREEME